MRTPGVPSRKHAEHHRCSRRTGCFRAVGVSLVLRAESRGGAFRHPICSVCVNAVVTGGLEFFRTYTNSWGENTHLHAPTILLPRLWVLSRCTTLLTKEKFILPVKKVE